MTKRPGLYLMVFFALMNSCDASIEAGRTGRELKRIADQLKDPPASAKPTLTTAKGTEQ